MSEVLSKPLPDVDGDIRRAMAEGIKAYPVRSNWISKLGHPCERYAVHNRVDWATREKHSVETELIFNGGRVLEQYIAKDYLQKAGFDIIEADRPVDAEKSGILRKLNISGRIDFIVRKKGETDAYPCEVKSMNQWSWEKINSVEDMILSDKPWIRAYPAQLQLYLIGKEYETGFFLLINKANYQTKTIWTQLDYQYVENLLQKAGRVNEHVAAGTYPERIEFEDKICGRCEFAHVCLENWARTEAKIVTETEVEERLDRIEELSGKVKPMNDEIEELKEWRKTFFDQVPKAIAGAWMIVGKLIKRKAFTVEAKEYWNVSSKKIGNNS